MLNGIASNIKYPGTWKLEKALNCAIWLPQREFQVRMAILAWLKFDPFIAPPEPCRRRLALRGISVPTNPLLRTGIESAVIAAYWKRQAEAEAAASDPGPAPVATVCGIPLYEASIDTCYIMDRLEIDPDQVWTPGQTRGVVFALSAPSTAIEAISSTARDYDAEAAEYVSGFPNANLGELAARCSELLTPIYDHTQTAQP